VIISRFIHNRYVRTAVTVDPRYITITRWESSRQLFPRANRHHTEHVENNTIRTISPASVGRLLRVLTGYQKHSNFWYGKHYSDWYQQDHSPMGYVVTKGTESDGVTVYRRDIDGKYQRIDYVYMSDLYQRIDSADWNQDDYEYYSHILSLYQSA
jgi:hypothetical protein